MAVATNEPEDHFQYEPWEKLTEGDRDLYRSDARTIIEAMRYPTEAMSDAGYGAANDAYLDSGAPGFSNGVWTAMIDKALRG